MACKRSPVRSRYSPPLAQIRVTNTVDFKSKSTVFLCLSASKFIAILQILCKIKVEVHMDLVSAINFYPADKLADDHLFCFKAGTIVQVCVRDQFFVQLRSGVRASIRSGHLRSGERPCRSGCRPFLASCPDASTFQSGHGIQHCSDRWQSAVRRNPRIHIYRRSAERFRLPAR